MLARLSLLVVLFFIAMSVLPNATAGQIAGCSDVRLNGLRVPGSIPDSLPSPDAYDRLTVGEVPLGVGHLRPVDAGYTWDWHQRMRRPMFGAPGSTPSLWLVDGWLMRQDGSVRPFGTGGMIETGYETPSFIVLESRVDGWLKIRYSANEGDAGAAWTHDCVLGLGAHLLVFESWEERLTSDDISPLFFTSEVPHALRASPSIDSEQLISIPGSAYDYELEPLAVDGDWMRVRVALPRTYCDPDAPTPRTEEGWVKWRDPERGPWLWYFTRGC